MGRLSLIMGAAAVRKIDLGFFSVVGSGVERKYTHVLRSNPREPVYQVFL